MIEGLGLIPIRNFGQVLPKIYRSAQPIYFYEYQWLKKLGIVKIINLRLESKHDDCAKQLGIEVVNIGIKDHFPPTMKQIDTFRQHLSEGILFHCAHGHGRTSTFSVITNMLNGKTVEEAIKIENDLFKYHFKHKQQEDFLKNLKL